jgi:hypothetical protein
MADSFYMHLYLSSRSPWNATYSNAEGQIIYKAEHPRTFFSSSPITVQRVLPNMRSFSLLAEIDYRTSLFRSPHIRYNGININTNDFFSKTGFLWRCDIVPEYDSTTDEIYSNRTFRGPDGKQYEWHLGSKCKVSNRISLYRVLMSIISYPPLFSE